MKIIISFMLALVTLSAFGFHPGDDEDLVNIGINTKLKVVKDINIVPNKSIIRIGKRCFLFLMKSVNYDRVLIADSVLTIIATGDTYSANEIYVDNMNISKIHCIHDTNKVISIGEFKEDTKETLQVKLADPTRI